MGAHATRSPLVRVGVDTGGTFTDFAATDGHALWTHKVPSTPDDPARAVLCGLRELLGDRAAEELTYATTVATNAVLERKGARVVLLTTAGFEDVLEIGRQVRPELYAIEPRRPAPLVPAKRRLGVRERMLASGVAALPLSRTEADRVVAAARSLGAESVAVCLLHSYRNPEHEEILAEALARAGLSASVSSRLVREYREVERFTTTVLNAYVAPRMRDHLEKLTSAMAGTRLRVMQSAGGAIAPRIAAGEPVRTLLSGPAAGAIGAARAAARLGERRVITFDMGGTSTDVSLIAGAPRLATEWAIAGFTLKIPAVDVHTVGAGGGSLARLDEGGALKVGPESAGADPGPACYGRGEDPTVTDADVVLGRLVPSAFLGGRMCIDAERARRAVSRIARVLGGSIEATAEGIARVVEANMVRAVRRISVERGNDPRDCTLVAFGGAAGMHACSLADGLGMRRVIFPLHPGLLSAWGALAADWHRDAVRTVRRIDPSVAALSRDLAPLIATVRRDLRQCAGPAARVEVEPLLDLRYAGQSYEITVPLDAAYRDAFNRAHLRLYGHAHPRRPVEVVNVRVVGRVAAGAVPPGPPAPQQSAEEEHLVWWQGTRLRARKLRREGLGAGWRRGPLVVTEATSTLFVPPGWAVRREATGDLVVERGATGRSR